MDKQEIERLVAGQCLGRVGLFPGQAVEDLPCGVEGEATIADLVETVIPGVLRMRKNSPHLRSYQARMRSAFSAMASPSLHSSIQRLAVAATVAETAVASNVSPRGCA